MRDRIEGILVYGTLIIVVGLFLYLAHTYYVAQTVGIPIEPGITPQGVANQSGYFIGKNR